MTLVVRTTFKHHIVGICFAAVLIGISWNFTERNDLQGEAEALKADLYKAYDSKDLMGLVRVGATKALDKNALVKVGYSPDQICSHDLKGFDTEKSVIQKVYRVNLGGENSNMLAGGDIQNIRQFCSSGVQGWGVSESSEFRSAMIKAGEKPTFVAVGRF